MLNGNESEISNNIEETYDNFDPSKDHYEWSDFYLKELDNEEEAMVDSSVPTTNLNGFTPSFNKFEIDKEKPKLQPRRDWGLFLRKNCKLSRIRNLIRAVLNSYNFTIIIIVFVVVNCLSIGGELITDYIRDVVYESKMEEETKNDFDSTTIGAFFIILEDFFKYTSLAILGLFVVEIVIKFIFVTKKFSKFNQLFDSFIVFIAFFLNLFLLNKKNHIHSVTGLITLIR